MGVTVKQRTKGKGQPWWVYICHQGKRKALKVGDKTAADAVASKIREQIKTGALNLAPQKQIPTFEEYATHWLAGYGETHLKYSTLKSYQSVLKHHLQSSFAPRPLDAITRADIRELIFTKLKNGYTPNTVAHIKALLSGILTHALDEGLLQTNPASRLGKLIKTKERKADVNPLTREEAKAFLEAMSEHSPRHFPFFLCALRTGMRLGELLGLQWGDIDFHGGFVEVRRASFKGRLVTPKNGKIRRIDMSRQLSETLKALHKERKAEALAKGWGEVPATVFVNEAGRILDGDHLRRRVFKRTLEKAGLREIRIHDLRHTFASMLIQNGESLAYVRDQMGHHSIQITVDTYGHLVPGANRQAVDRLDDEILTTYGQEAGCV